MTIRRVNLIPVEDNLYDLGQKDISNGNYDNILGQYYCIIEPIKKLDPYVIVGQRINLRRFCDDN